ncbi:hypothetical protein J3F83DRAFT_223310 [Trichoderma novae-zelandiae]
MISGPREGLFWISLSLSLSLSSLLCVRLLVCCRFLLGSQSDLPLATFQILRYLVRYTDCCSSLNFLFFLSTFNTSSFLSFFPLELCALTWYRRLLLSCVPCLVFVLVKVCYEGMLRYDRPRCPRDAVYAAS